MKKQKRYNYLGIPYVWWFLAWLCCAGVFLFVYKPDIGSDPEYNVSPQGKIALRGDNILVIRSYDRGKLIEKLAIFKDKQVVRVLPLHKKNQVIVPRTTQQLPPDVWEEVNQLRLQWCQEPPSFPALAERERRYSIGIRCAPFNQKTFYLAPDQLPSVLRFVLETVPTPQPVSIIWHWQMDHSVGGYPL
jgi:hypothetical protein